MTLETNGFKIHFLLFSRSHDGRDNWRKKCRKRRNNSAISKKSASKTYINEHRLIHDQARVKLCPINLGLSNLPLLVNVQCA